MRNERCETPDKLVCSMPDDILEEVNCLHAYVNKHNYNYNVVRAMAKSIEEMVDIKEKTEKVIIDTLNKCAKKGKL